MAVKDPKCRAPAPKLLEHAVNYPFPFTIRNLTYRIFQFITGRPGRLTPPAESEEPRRSSKRIQQGESANKNKDQSESKPKRAKKK